MAKSVSTAPLKASDLKSVYTGQRDLKSIAIKKDSIRLSGDGVFYTLQGEGPTIGLPALFVRLHHCNLACTWCDAYYTWDKDSPEFWTESFAVDYESLIEWMQVEWPIETGERRVVWTGGEPLMQKNQMDEVMQMLWSDHSIPFWHPEVETNGTIMPTQLQQDNYQFNVSPKLPNSGNPIAKCVKEKVLRRLNKCNSTFKFVCRNEGDLDQINLFYSRFIDEDKIIIMPEGVTEEEITPHARALAEPCKERGLRLLPRLQAIAFDGAARGV